EDPGAEIVEAPLREIVVHAGGAALLPEHLAEEAGAEHPLMQRHPAHPHRVGEILVGTRTVAVHRQAKGIHSEPRHSSLLRDRPDASKIRFVVPILCDEASPYRRFTILHLRPVEAQWMVALRRGSR